MPDTANTAQLAQDAVQLLATGTGEIKHRLLRAYVEKFQFVFPEQVPDTIGSLVNEVRARLTREPYYPGQSTVEAALYRMHKTTAATIAAQIFEVDRALRLHGR